MALPPVKLPDLIEAVENHIQVLGRLREEEDYTVSMIIAAKIAKRNKSLLRFVLPKINPEKLREELHDADPFGVRWWLNRSTKYLGKLQYYQSISVEYIDLDDMFAQVFWNYVKKKRQQQ